MWRMAALLVVSMYVGLFGVVRVSDHALAAMEKNDQPSTQKPRPPKDPIAVPKPQEIPPQREQGCADHMRRAEDCENPRVGCECGKPCRSNRCEIGCAPPQSCRDECEKGSACKPDRNQCRDQQPRGDSKAATLPSDGKLKLEDFALYAERSLRLGECSRVEGGDLGVRSYAETSGAQLQIGKKAWIDPQRIISAHSVSIGEGATFGLVAATHFRDNGIVLAPPAAFQPAGMPAPATRARWRLKP